jgi:uncharacterized membrane protein
VSKTFACGIAAAAWLTGAAVHWNNGFYNPWALLLITAAIAIGAFACLSPPLRAIESLSGSVAVVALAAAILIDIVLMWQRAAADPIVVAGIAGLGVLGVVQTLDLRTVRLPLIGVLLGVFWIVASMSVRLTPPPQIDVLMFQQMGAAALLDGKNPYEDRYPNLYERHPEFYGPGVIDANKHLTVGLPYPPLSLVLTLPGYLLGGDSRYADVAAVVASAGLMFLSGASRWTGLMAALFLLTPRVLFLIQFAWTETIFAFTFSLMMFCAVRWRSALPYALGLFLATKQYSVFALPFVPLLLGRTAQRHDAVRLVAVALVVAAVVTLPFFLWNPQAFWRSVVVFQFLQPLRADSLSYVVWIHKYVPGFPGLPSISFVVLAAMATLLWWRRQPTPAYFAGAVGVMHLAFFAFSKQAFANYYYFVIAALCWGAAVACPAGDERRECEPG